MDAINNRTRKRKASTSEAQPVPELPDEIVVEILVRLPVKSLVRCTSVCKAWQAVVSDPVFIRAHLRSSASRCEQDPAFLITPITFDRLDPGETTPRTFSSRISFYQWQQCATNGGKAARFKHAKDFAGEFNRFCYFAHCDGLVLALTDTKLYLFNPATRDAITLPDSERNERNGARGCHCAGLGRDPRTGKYKVVQAFFLAIYAGFLTNVHLVGMEVLTVGGDGVWRETMTRPPYPVWNWQTGIHIKGFMYWRIDDYHNEGPVPRGLLRLSLADEKFSVTGLPESLDPALHYSFSL
ncbi:hypothetical protein PVAP13_2KG353500 [Panicum virgatum]|uniref:F-box domain-containing protein n=1 Tax=Panicum virgatum TaxID=38727 RepID=A0A8T0W698_PANVG|nr:hypothetical protein PVAP13_2KG353500 [Panicum virgatum]